MTSSKHRSTRVDIHPHALDVIEEVSRTLGVNKVIVTSALVEGAMRAGNPASLVDAWLGRHPEVRNQTRPVPGIEWVRETGLTTIAPGQAVDPSRWRHEEWTLTRLGDSRSSAARAEPGNGWYLEGPGLVTPRYLGQVRPEAQREAAQIITRIKDQARATEPAAEHEEATSA